MSVLLREDVLTWLALLCLGGTALLSAVHVWGARGSAGASRWCAGLGAYFLVLSLVARGVQVWSWPLSSTYEMVLLVAVAVALFSALGLPSWLQGLGSLCAGLGAGLLLLLALLLTPAGVRAPLPAPPVLGGVWFPLHVVVTGVGCGGLLLSGFAALGCLFLAGREDRGDQRRAWAALCWRALSWGYPWLTLGMALGALWGWLSWGTYWSWSVKEVLSLLTWGLFTLAFHTRRLKGWQGRPHAAVLAVGLLALLLTLLAAESLAQRLLPTARYIF